jgi:arginyl-tRNA synthetase
MRVKRLLNARLIDAMRAAGVGDDCPPLLAVAGRPEFGDYQANGCMAAGKKRKTNPRALAEEVVGHLDLGGIASKVEVAGPGFINITLDAEWLAEQCRLARADDRLGVPRVAEPQRVVVDYCGPNLAKEMHVGHLRSTIIGDALARVLEFLGHDVIRQNHIGDWGTQFGMLVAHLETLPRESRWASLADLEEFYRAAKRRFDEEEGFADRARQYVVRLHAGDAEVLAHWRGLIEESLRHCHQVTQRLGTTLGPEHVRGESSYNDELPDILAQLDAKGLLSESQGAKVVFLDEFKTKDGEPLPVIVEKSGGGFLYPTTDLAALRYRAGELGADRILYVVDARQSLHFRQVFAVARKAGFVGEPVSLEHVAFGMMLGEDGRPFKTRTGGTVKLKDLLDEAERRARELVDAKNPDLPEGRKREVASAVGVGGLKYADLAQNPASDYVFTYDKMLALDGNTAPYMQYAYARIRSIFRKGGLVSGEGDTPIRLHDPAERALGLKLLQLPEALQAVADDCLPNVLCAYIYELAGTFMGFYESCPVLQAPDEATRDSRLALCDLTSRVIAHSLGLLGISVIEQM